MGHARATRVGPAEAAAQRDPGPRQPEVLGVEVHRLHPHTPTASPSVGVTPDRRSRVECQKADAGLTSTHIVADTGTPSEG